MSNELKPCPFCGNRPQIVNVEGGFYITCWTEWCPAEMVEYYNIDFTHQDAIEKWNTRKCEFHG